MLLIYALKRRTPCCKGPKKNFGVVRYSVLFLVFFALCDRAPAADFLVEGTERKGRAFIYLPVKAVKGLRAAKVFTTTYKRVASSVGNWRGRVQGLGQTSVFLRFISNGEVIDKRLIGRVYLENEPNGVFFSYRGTIPKQPALKWDIIAVSENIS